MYRRPFCMALLAPLPSGPGEHTSSGKHDDHGCILLDERERLPDARRPDTRSHRHARRCVVNGVIDADGITAAPQTR